MVFAISYIISMYKNSILFQRMNELFTNFEHEQRFEVYSLYFSSMENMWISGFGIGQSSQGIFGIANDYPHNFILEFGSEFGVIGFMFITTFILNTFFIKKMYLEHEYIYYKMSFVFFLYMFFIFSKSFGIYDSYLLFLSFGFLWSFGKNKLKKELIIERTK